MAADPTTTGPSSAGGAPRNIFARFRQWLPAHVDRRVIAAAWATLVVQVGIVGTGGLVRLTGSGLGCPTWPRCTAESLVPTPEMGIHGIIEFGNRLLTFVLVIVAIVMFLFVVRMRRERRDLFWLVAGRSACTSPCRRSSAASRCSRISTRTSSGLHYFASVVLVALSAVLVTRVYAVPGPAPTRRAGLVRRHHAPHECPRARDRRRRHPRDRIRSARRGRRRIAQRTEPRVHAARPLVAGVRAPRRARSSC